MVDLSQYNHILYVKAQSNSQQNASGQWVSGSATWEEWCECRLDSRSSSRSRIGDGEQKSDTATIYTPSGVDSVEDEIIQVRDASGKTLFEGVVITHRITRFHTTITAQ